jgi:hypothetical protein
MARGARGPADLDSAIVDRKIKVPTNSVRSLGVRDMTLNLLGRA